MDRERWLIAGTVPQPYLTVAAAVLGAGTMFGAGAYLLLFVIPLIWAWSSNRYTAALTMFVFYCAAGAPIAPAVRDYQAFQSTLFGWGLLTLLAVAALSALPWFFLYRQNDQWLTLRLFAVALLTLAPPLGLFQPAWPFLSAAYPFPGFGVIGIALLIIFLSQAAKRPLLALAPLSLSLFWFLIPPAYASSVHWQAHHTKVPMGFYTLDFARSYLALRDVSKSLRSTPDATMHVLPESVAGLDRAATASALARPTGFTIFAGGGEPQTDQSLRSVFFEYSDPNPAGRIIYRQRVPIPLLSGEALHPFANPVTYSNQTRLGFLLCYEGFAAWTPFITAVARPDVIVAGANLAFSNIDQLLASAFRAHLNVWARLFNKPLVIAINSRPTTQ